jgi:hypothetical protein
MLRLSAAFGLAALGSGNQYDVLFPNYVAPSECPQGCAAWADIEKDGVANMTQDAVAKLFRNGTVHPDAGSQCIMPGASPVHGEGRRMLTSDDEEDRWLWDTASKRGPNCDDRTVLHVQERRGGRRGDGLLHPADVDAGADQPPVRLKIRALASYRTLSL